MTHTSHTITPVGGWDRAAILTLGAAGCALSYDALQQMAVAIHIRGLLTYLYPLVIDGFIGYGVRALILTRTAPWRARLYVWTLFGTATAASIWANALHAVRLNQLAHASGAGLRLGDITVGVLSTLAPLALAGAVHLYILITRHQHSHTVRGPVRDGQAAAADRSTDQDRPVDGPQKTVRTGPHEREVTGGDSGPVRTLGTRTADGSTETVRTLSGPPTAVANGPLPLAPAPQGYLGADRDRARPHAQALETSAPVSLVKRADRSAPGTDPADRPRSADGETVRGPSAAADRSAAGQRTNTSAADQGTRTGPQESAEQRTGPQKRSAPLGSADADRRAADAAGQEGADRSAADEAPDEQDVEELLPIARAAVKSQGRINRTVVRGGLREHQIQVSNQRLGLILQRLRDEAKAA
ncbi:DUF2637 domain-containing protein [Streptomyces olivoreticuli]